MVTSGRKKPLDRRIHGATKCQAGLEFMDSVMGAGEHPVIAASATVGKIRRATALAVMIGGIAEPGMGRGRALYRPGRTLHLIGILAHIPAPFARWILDI